MMQHCKTFCKFKAPKTGPMFLKEQVIVGRRDQESRESALYHTALRNPPF